MARRARAGGLASPPVTPLDSLDRDALVRGVVVGGAVAVPLGVVASVAADRDDPPGWTGWAVVVVLLGLSFGAALAAWSQQRGTPLTHGIVVALGVFVAVQAVGVLRRLVSGEGIAWSQVFSSAVLATLAGLLGGLVGGRTARRAPPPTSRSS